MKKVVILFVTFFVCITLTAQVALTLPEINLEEQPFYDNWQISAGSFFVLPVKLNEYIDFQTLSFNITYDPTVVAPLDILDNELMEINSNQYIQSLLIDNFSPDFSLLESGQITSEIFEISTNESLLTINYSSNEGLSESIYDDYNGNLMYLPFRKIQACYESPIFFNFFNGYVNGSFINPNQTNAFIIETMSTENGELITENGIVNFSIIMANVFQNGSMMESVVSGGAPPYSYNWTDKMCQTLETNPSFFPDSYSDYLLYVSDVNGCISSLYFSFEPVSIDEFSTLKIYPNPAQERIHIQLEKSTCDYQLLDVHGRIINYGTVNSIVTINRNSLPSGLYFLKLQVQDKLVTKTIIFN